ncbi:hypothetical protein SK128_012771, partial [Halocaridina rubra]
TKIVYMFVKINKRQGKTTFPTCHNNAKYRITQDPGNGEEKKQQMFPSAAMPRDVPNLDFETRHQGLEDGVHRRDCLQDRAIIT